jgi:sporulation protein YlmC with PRC-barrel domain
MALRLSDLVGKMVYDQNDVKLGKIDEVRVKDSYVEALICGPAARLQRMSQWRAGTRIEWETVMSVDENAVRVRSKRHLLR